MQVPWKGRWSASGCAKLTEPNLGRTEGITSFGRFRSFRNQGAGVPPPQSAPGVVSEMVPLP